MVSDHFHCDLCRKVTHTLLTHGDMELCDICSADAALGCVGHEEESNIPDSDIAGETVPKWAYRALLRQINAEIEELRALRAKVDTFAGKLSIVWDAVKGKK